MLLHGKGQTQEIMQVFSQNIVLCMCELQIDIQLKATIYALLNFCLNSGLSMTV